MLQTKNSHLWKVSYTIILLGWRYFVLFLHCKCLHTTSLLFALVQAKCKELYRYRKKGLILCDIMTEVQMKWSIITTISMPTMYPITPTSELHKTLQSDIWVWIHQPGTYIWNGYAGQCHSMALVWVAGQGIGVLGMILEGNHPFSLWDVRVRVNCSKIFVRAVLSQ